jgi:hypothetical protein
VTASILNARTDMKIFWTQVFQDDNKVFSSKRVVAGIATLCLVIAFSCDLFFHLTSSQFIFNGLLTLDLGALGITAVEKFTDTTQRVKTDTKTDVKADVKVEDDSPPASK